MKGVSPRYRALLCQLFGVTAEQLGLAPVSATTPSRPVRDAESLISMLDDAASMLDQLGAAGTALAPQMLSAWKDAVTSRRTMLGLRDPCRYRDSERPRTARRALPGPAPHRRPCRAAHPDHSACPDGGRRAGPRAHRRPRRRLLRNRATVATLAGRLAYEDLGAAASARSYYSLALDSAQEAGNHQLTAIVLGYTAQLAHTEGMTSAALDHLSAAFAHAERALTAVPWLAIIQATIHADIGAAIGHAHLQAGHHTEARAALTAALDQLPPTARRARIVVLTDLAMTELHAGNLPDACRHAIAAAGLLRRTPYATGVTRLRAFRAAAERPIGPRALRVLDEHLAA